MASGTQATGTEPGRLRSNWYYSTLYKVEFKVPCGIASRRAASPVPRDGRTRGVALPCDSNRSLLPKPGPTECREVHRAPGQGSRPRRSGPPAHLHKVRLGSVTIWRYPGHLGQPANSLGRTGVQVASRTRPAALFSIQHHGRKTGVPLLRDPNCYPTR